ncbi:MAG: bifunctional glutamate N-acetyltransferase/amino-acid acetyltransferase ArgJ [Myxococcaceae bacterium]
MKTAKGFTYSGVHAGIKPYRKDLALVLSEAPCVAAACFTANKAKAAPILEAETRLPGEGFRAVLINSGNANSLTGNAGVEDVRRVLSDLGTTLKLPASTLLSASTGVIGVRLPVQKVINALPKLVKEQRVDPELAAEAIMTTDTRVKMATRTLSLSGHEVTLSALAKGSGMIAPQLATVICVIVTDCQIAPAMLDKALTSAMTPSFNSLTVDGDMSPNDTVYALANGLAGNPRIQSDGPDLHSFQAALTDLCEEMAREIALDGEGSTKLLHVMVLKAPDEACARDLAKSIAGSSLVKTAVFGADPNWGRILATVGARAGSQGYALDPHRSEVTVQGVTVYRNEPQAHDRSLLKSKMREPEVRISVDLGAGSASAVAYGCDLSYDYVKINADYTSLIVQSEDGAVAKDDRLSNYSPKFKQTLLVEALSYISQFSGRRCVIKYGGAAMVKESLKRAFCNDINLLRSVGLKPVVVHGGGPEITKALDRLGTRTKWVDGERVTTSSDVKVMEMVLSGSINSEIVTLLNRQGGHAVGVSGKDGALLKARKLVTEGKKDLGQIGEITQVNRAFLEMLLDQGYVPVISPIGIGDDGASYNTNADAVAAEVAVAVAATKLIFLTDVPGILESGDLVTDLTGAELAKKVDAGTITGGMRVKARSILKALSGGVERVHVIDGRTPHSVIAELFTDRGVGTLVTS